MDNADNGRSERSSVPTLGLSYEFRDGKMIFSDGVEYSIDEAAALARDRLTDDDLRAIHLVKRIFDGTIMDCAGAARRMIHDADQDGPDEMTSGPPCSSLDDLGESLGPPPIIGGS